MTVRELLGAVGDVLRDPVVPIALLALVVAVGWLMFLAQFPLADVVRGYVLGWAVILAAIALLAVHWEANR